MTSEITLTVVVIFFQGSTILSMVSFNPDHYGGKVIIITLIIKAIITTAQSSLCDLTISSGRREVEKTGKGNRHPV